MKNQHLLRQVKDLQHQATKLISGKPNVQSIEQFGKYAEEIKAFLKKEELIPELKKLVNEIPSIPQNKITPRSGALALLAPNFLMYWICLLYTSPSPRDATLSRMPSSA